MAKPVRIQRKRTKGWKMPPNTVYVGRPSRWGNPFKPVRGVLRETCVEQFRRRMASPRQADELTEIMLNLKGKNLACWCPLIDQHGNAVPCHADVLLEIANRDSSQTGAG